MTTTTMTETRTPSETSPVQLVAEAIQPNGSLGHDAHARAVISAVRANTDHGAALRAALGVEVTQGTRTGKNIKAAMDAYLHAGNHGRP